MGNLDEEDEKKQLHQMNHFARLYSSPLNSANILLSAFFGGSDTRTQEY